ncbi:MAG: hypothetical protein C5B60_07770 [Chloroflexi bacterium]|nr:MAG: hypothetical protein C5B60_07770 [Chloroflexota bacterium]
MNMTGYTNPLRSDERKLSPDFPSREFRDPGLRMPHASGLGSLRHTMPHLRRLSGTMHFQGGGGLGGNPVGAIAAASRPNLYNPDPQFRQFLQLINQTPLVDTQLRRAPSPAADFVYQGGGEVDQDVGELASPDQEMSPQEQQERQIVLNAMAALDGQSPDPEADLKAFIDTFGKRALADLQQLVEQKHEEDQGGEEEEEEQEPEPEEDEELQQAGGGLLHGKGTGQSDEIEGTTPSGRPVLLSDGEYVIDAPTVAALGDGSTKAGARRLDDMRKQIRKSAYGHDRQAKPMKKGGATVVLKLK